MSKKGLGRGLGALIPELDIEGKDREGAGVVEVEVGRIRPNPKQPRKSFDDSALEELAASIREHGVVQPILVRPKGKGYELVAGERRWRAAQRAGLKKVPAVIREFSEKETMEIALIENLQREDLNPLEEAEAYRVLLEEFALTQDELAKRLGKSRPQISNTLRLLQLGGEAREAVRSGRISMGHAKVLLGVEDSRKQDELVRRVTTEGWSVRELEAAVKQSSDGKKKASRRVERRLEPELLELERRLGELFGTPVKIVAGEQKGKIEITYFGQEGLERIVEAIGLSEPVRRRPPREPFRV